MYYEMVSDGVRILLNSPIKLPSDIQRLLFW